MYVKLLVLIPLVITIFLIPPQIRASTQIPVLMYHYIRNFTYPGDPEGHVLSVSLANFDAQMNYLKQQGYTPIDLETMYAIETGQVTSPSKPIVLTFDDGTIDFYANAYPILKKYNFHATSFVITGFVGGPAYLSWNNIHEMENSGLISFEDHTVNHEDLAVLPYSSVVYEVGASKQVLEQETGKTVNFIAYPDGASDYAVWLAVERAGYLAGFGTWYGLVSHVNTDMPRVRVSGGESLEAFSRSL